LSTSRPRRQPRNDHAYFEYDGTVGQTQYFVSGRYLPNNLGIENPTPANEAIHDHTSQEKGSLYFSASMIYGSGLRSGFANTDHVPSYTQVNVGLSHEYLFPGWTKPTTVRFDVVNLFDKIYQIRDGSGIGVFAPQFGPRRGFYVGISQKI
jgi:outer membrane receptor protein involved in Fe transport